MAPSSIPSGVLSDELGALAAEILALAAVEDNLETLLSQIIVRTKRATGFEAVGLRLKDGEDFPYYFTAGFDDYFVKMEMSLCARDPLGELIRDTDGNPYLECMCGNIICGRTDPSMPFFTRAGSFVSNGTSALLASTTEADRQARTRNRCNAEGYESVGLFPIKLGNTIYGLLQLNDRRTDQFSAPLVALLEAVAVAIGMVFRLRQFREDVTERARDVQVGLTARAAILERIAKELEARRGGDQAIPAALFTTLGELLDDLSRTRGVVPICAGCKRVREPGKQWFPVERFMRERSHLQFSHTYCPECFEKAVQEIENTKR